MEIVSRNYEVHIHYFCAFDFTFLLAASKVFRFKAHSVVRCTIASYKVWGYSLTAPNSYSVTRSNTLVHAIFMALQ